MFKLIQIGFLIGAAIFVGAAIYRYPLIAVAAALIGILVLAAKIKSGRAL